MTRLPVEGGIEEIIDPRETRPLLCDWVHDAYAALPASPGPALIRHPPLTTGEP